MSPLLYLAPHGVAFNLDTNWTQTMHLEKNRNGICYCRFNQDGRWIRRSLRTNNKRQAQRNLANLGLSGQKQERLAGAVECWLTEQERRDITENHLNGLLLIGRELTSAFGALFVEDIKRGKLLPWLQEKPRRLRFARAFFRWCVAEDLRQTDPCQGAAQYLKRKEPTPPPPLRRPDRGAAVRSQATLPEALPAREVPQRDGSALCGCGKIALERCRRRARAHQAGQGQGPHAPDPGDR
jgi:hypothetical protein